MIDILQHERPQQRIILHVHNGRKLFEMKGLIINRELLAEREVTTLEFEGVETNFAP